MLYYRVCFNSDGSYKHHFDINEFNDKEPIIDNAGLDYYYVETDKDILQCKLINNKPCFDKTLNELKQEKIKEFQQEYIKAQKCIIIDDDTVIELDLQGEGYKNGLFGRINEANHCENKILANFEIAGLNLKTKQLQRYNCTIHYQLLQIIFSQVKPIATENYNIYSENAVNIIKIKDNIELINLCKIELCNTIEELNAINSKELYKYNTTIDLNILCNTLLENKEISKELKDFIKSKEINNRFDIFQLK
jgi:hypothetical protein